MILEAEDLGQDGEDQGGAVEVERRPGSGAGWVGRRRGTKVLDLLAHPGALGRLEAGEGAAQEGEDMHEGVGLQVAQPAV